MLPALCASTEGTRGRQRRRLGGLRVHTAPVASRSASQQIGYSMSVRPAINGAYLVWHDVLLHPIRRQEPHPISYH